MFGGILDTKWKLEVNKGIIFDVPRFKVSILPVVVPISHEQLWSYKHNLLVQYVNLTVVQSALKDYRSSDITKDIFC